MMRQSGSVPPSLVPASALFYATPIAGSPINTTTVLPRGEEFTPTNVNREEINRVPAVGGSRAPTRTQEEVRTVR